MGGLQVLEDGDGLDDVSVLRVPAMGMIAERSLGTASHKQSSRLATRRSVSLRSTIPEIARSELSFSLLSFCKDASGSMVYG